jgi:hypothetical protein
MTSYPNLPPKGWHPLDTSGPSYTAICQFLRDHGISRREIFPPPGILAQNPLHTAAAGGHLDLVKFLLEGKANPEAKLSSPIELGPQSGTALTSAIGSGHVAVARHLLDRCKLNPLEPAFHGVGFSLATYMITVRETYGVNLSHSSTPVVMDDTKLPLDMLELWAASAGDYTVVETRVAYDEALIRAAEAKLQRFFRFLVDKAKVQQRPAVPLLFRHANLEFIKGLKQEYKLDLTPTFQEICTIRSCLNHATESLDLEKVRYCVEELGIMPEPTTGQFCNNQVIREYLLEKLKLTQSNVETESNVD